MKKTIWEILMKYVALQSRDVIDDSEWRVEAVDHESEGECYVAIFCGPKARERAEEYAVFKN